MKILYVTTVSSTLDFFPEHIRMLQKAGHTVEFAAHRNKPMADAVSALNCTYHEVGFSRSPLSADNIRACRELKKIVEAGKVDLVHCHTPNAAAITRLVCRKMRRQGLKVFYTCHGFHFYKGAPFKNWLLFYPAEWLCSFWTDKLITINSEDYRMAQRHLHSGETLYVPGVGVAAERFRTAGVTRVQERKKLELPEDAFVLMTVGELNQNKNQSVVVQAMAMLQENDIHYVIVGGGDYEQKIRACADNLGLSDRVHLLGVRKDVPELLKAADVYLLPSFREGLNVSIMEAMASGLPVACSRIRGNEDLVDETGGAFFAPGSAQEVSNAIASLRREDRGAMGHYNCRKVEKFSQDTVLKLMKDAYQI